MVRFAKPHVSVISTDLGRNIMVLISLDFTKGNLIVRFGIPLISVIFKNSAAVTNTQSGLPTTPHMHYVGRTMHCVGRAAHFVGLTAHCVNHTKV